MDIFASGKIHGGCMYSDKKIRYQKLKRNGNIKVINYFIDEIVNNRNLDAANEIVSEDFIEHVPFPGQEQGREGLKSVLNSMFTGFPDMHWTINEQVSEGEKVVTRFTWTGTHQGTFMGIPATNKSVEVW